MAAKNEGMSTSKKVIAGAAVGVALPAAVGAAKKLIGDDGDDKSTKSKSPRRSSPSRSKSSSGSKSSSRSKSSSTRGRSLKSRATSRSAAKSRAKKSSSSNNSSASPTREQLYKMATRLKIAGRSSMSKSQLQRAVSRAKSRA